MTHTWIQISSTILVKKKNRKPRKKLAIWNCKIQGHKYSKIFWSINYWGIFLENTYGKFYVARIFSWWAKYEPHREHFIHATKSNTELEIRDKTTLCQSSDRQCALAQTLYHRYESVINFHTYPSYSSGLSSSYSVTFAVHIILFTYTRKMWKIRRR